MVFENQDIEDRIVIENATTTTILDYQNAMLNTQTEDYNNKDHNNNDDNNTYNNSRRSTNHYQHNNNQQLKQKWTKPRTGFIKANCDANLSIDGTWGLRSNLSRRRGPSVGFTNLGNVWLERPGDCRSVCVVPHHETSW